MGDIDSLLATDVQQETIIMLVINFIMCAILALILRSFYVRYSKSLTGKEHVGTVLPVLAMVVFLVILVVKSSLALSLGLVGALSIVRFRTPVKEPEELVYLFLTIAIGLGFGAGFTILTTVTVLAILGVIYVFLRGEKSNSPNEINLILSWKDLTVSYSDILEACSASCSHVAVLRISDSQTEKSCVASVALNIDAKIDDIVNSLKALNPGIEINMHNADTNW